LTADCRFGLHHLCSDVRPTLRRRHCRTVRRSRIRPT